MRTITSVVTAVCLLAFPVSGSSLNELDYQGKVLLNDIPFTGNGLFKFAISDSGNTTNYWAHDGTGVGEPAGSITNPVWNGLFSVILGSSPMTPIDSSTFNSTNSRYLRVWFNSGAGFNEMLPSQKIVGGAYAINAVLLDGQSASSIQSNAVALATNAITLAGDVAGLPHANSISPGVIVDADVNASAAIDGTKIVQATTSVRGTIQIASGSTGTTAIASGHPYLNAFSSVNSITAAGPNSGFGIVGSNGISIGTSGTNIVVSLSGSPLDNVKWVAINGTAAGPGTIDFPYDTPQAGYDAAAAAFPGRPSAVVIAGGDYGPAMLTMSSGTVHVIGLHRPQIGGLFVTAPVSPVISGMQTVEGIVVKGTTAGVGPAGVGVRFHNCRFDTGFLITGHHVLFQNCRIVAPAGAITPALGIAIAPATMSGNVGIYQSSIENNDPAFGAIEIGLAGMPTPNVQGLEVIGCEIVNLHTNGPAIQDWSPWHFPAPFPLNIYSHNYIKGPKPGTGFPAVADPGAVFPYPPGPPAEGPVFGFYNNTVYGDVGSVVAGVAHPQFHGNNMIYGLITYPGIGPVGWLQAGGGTGADPYGNIQHEIAFPPTMPDFWED